MDAVEQGSAEPESAPATALGRWAWNWMPALAMMGLIFLISGTPNLGAVPGGVSDKAGHFTGYAILGGLMLRAFARVSWAGVTPASAVLAWGLTALYGASDEFHQHFVPGRTVAFDDWVADALGAATAITLLVIAAYGRSLEDRRV